MALRLRTTKHLGVNGASAYRAVAGRQALRRMEPGRMEQYCRARTRLYFIMAALALALGMLIAFLDGSPPGNGVGP